MVTSCNDYHNIVASLALFTARDIGIIRGRHCVWCIQIFEMFLDCCLIVYNAYVIVWSSVFVASFTTQVYWFVAAAAAGCCGPWLHCILEWHFRIVQNVDVTLVCHFALCEQACVHLYCCGVKDSQQPAAAAATNQYTCVVNEATNTLDQTIT